MAEKAHGLKWIARRGGRVPYWVASEAALAAGYPIKTVRLERLADDPAALAERCRSLQQDMLHWMTGEAAAGTNYDLTFGSLIDIYKGHEESPLHELSPSTKETYGKYLPRLRQAIGAKRVDKANGLDLKRWHKEWSSGGKHIGAGKMAAAVLAAALRFGKALRLAGCAEFLDLLREARLPRTQPRTAVASAEHVQAFIATAKARGHGSLALAAAIQYETFLRLFDVTGQWYPMTDPRLSSVVDSTGKWFGLMWSDISTDLILTWTPTKTGKTTGKSVVADLKRCPMVMAELAAGAPIGERRPVVTDPKTGLPYHMSRLEKTLSMLRRKAGWPKGLWSRDLRASGITEARAAGAALDDVSKVAAHSTPRTTGKVYDRAVFEAHARVRDALTKNKP